MNVVVKFDPWGRMGNRMFQYAFGYILAQQKNAKLLTNGLPNFNIDSTYTDAPMPVKQFIYTSKYGKNNANWNELVALNGDVIVDSYVQRYSFYANHKDTLKEVFNIKDAPINKDKLVVHIRETDYKDIGVFLGYNYYRKLIDESGFTDIIIVTDNSPCETVQKLISDGCKLSTEGYVSKFEHTSDTRSMLDFETLLQSENIAISQSSFSWWAAFLGNHKKVIFPYKQSGGMWPITPNQDDIDLYIDNPNSNKFIL